MDRRHHARIPVGFYAHQVVDGEPHWCFASDLSVTGVYLERVFGPTTRRDRRVQLEIPLPGLEEPLWAGAEVVHEKFDRLFHGSAVRFTAMAGRDRQRLRSWLGRARRATPRPREVVVTSAGVQIIRPHR